MDRRPAGLKPRHYGAGVTLAGLKCLASAGLKPRHYVCVLAIVAASCRGGALAPPPAASITVAAAASVADVIGDLGKRFEAAHGTRVEVNAGGSGTLARQIVDGAPMDLFFSADNFQMDVVKKAGRVVDGSELPLLTNQLVVVVPRDSAAIVTKPDDLASPSLRRIAIGQPDSVPAGVYAREWLERQGLWSAVQAKAVPLPTVRAALAAVRERRADAAIVYLTDTRNAEDVRVAYRVEPAGAPAITYPVALIKGQREAAARAFLTYLQSDEARRTFEGAGFGVLPREK